MCVLVSGQNEAAWGTLQPTSVGKGTKPAPSLLQSPRCLFLVRDNTNLKTGALPGQRPATNEEASNDQRWMDDFVVIFVLQPRCRGAL